MRNSGYTNSPLVDITELSPNHTLGRTCIRGFVVHVTVSVGTVLAVLLWLARTIAQSSYNYVVGRGQVGLCVDERNRAWASSNRECDMNTLSIGVNNSSASHPYPISDQDYNKLIDLLVDCCERNNIMALAFAGDNANFRLQWSRGNMMLHKWFAAKACPGQYLIDRMARICDEVNGRLKARMFVTRLYSGALNRAPDASGLDYWLTQLRNGATGSAVARGFITSREFVQRNLSNADYVEALYRAMLGRVSDSAGKAYWISLLNRGAERLTVLDGFLTSREFISICADHGIRNKQ